jgi:ribonuclease-3
MRKSEQQKMQKFLQGVGKKIGHAFLDPNLLKLALTHSSYAYEYQQGDIENNEVLEFLGDSVLGFVIADFLCAKYYGLSEGDLSKLKSAVASTSALSEFAKKLRLDKSILLGKGEAQSGGRTKKTILAGCFEAVVAAVYKDGGIQAASQFLNPLLVSFFKKVNLDKFLINNYKSALQEYLQKENLPAPIYKPLRAAGPDHNKKFTVEVFSNKKILAQADGKSKKDAEQRAAQKALKSLLGRKIKSFTADVFLLKKDHD